MINVRKVIAEEAKAWRAVPFAWGTADCLCFAAAVAGRILGRDPIAHFRGRYHDEASWKRAMVEEGFRSHGDVIASLFPEIPVAQARAGDWVVIDDERGWSGIGVVVDSRVAVQGYHGYVQLPLTRATQAFRVA